MSRWGRSEVERINRKHPYRMLIKDELTYKLKKFWLKMKFQTQRILFKENRKLLEPSHETLSTQKVFASWDEIREDMILNNRSIELRKWKSLEEGNPSQPKRLQDGGAVVMEKQKTDTGRKFEEENFFQFRILTYEADTFQRYSHYRTIIKDIASWLKNKYGIEEEILLPKACCARPKLAVAVDDGRCFERKFLKEDPVNFVDCSFEQAVETVDCLVVLLEKPETEGTKQHEYLRTRISSLQRECCDFLTVIFIIPEAKKYVSGDVNSNEICFVEVSEDEKQIKPLIVSSLERRLLIALDKFKEVSVEYLVEEDQWQLEMEIDVHSSSLRKSSVLFKVDETVQKQEIPKHLPEVLKEFLERYKEGIFEYGVFFQEFIVYVDKAYEEIEEMRLGLKKLEQHSEMVYFKKIILIPTNKIDPEPLRLCGKALYNKGDADTSSGTLGGLAVIIDSESNKKTKVGVSCYHVTKSVDDWFVWSNDMKLARLGSVIESSDRWITRKKDEIFCDFSLIKIDESFLDILEKEDFLYISLSGKKHTKVEILGIENALSIQPEERHVYRLNQREPMQFIRGLILGYMWRPSEQSPDKKLRSLVVIKSTYQRHDMEKFFAKRGDSGSLIFFSKFEESGDEKFYVRGMVTHGFVGEEYTNGNPEEKAKQRGKHIKVYQPRGDDELLHLRDQQRGTSSGESENSANQLPGKKENENPSRETEPGASAQSLPKDIDIKIQEGSEKDYRLYTYCMEMDKANEKLNEETNKNLVFDMTEFEK